MKQIVIKACTCILFFFVIVHIQLVAQNVGINTTGAIPNSSALLDIDAGPVNDKGILIPRIALQATDLSSPVTSPATSLLVYNTATNGVTPTNVIPGFYYWDGTAWVSMEETIALTGR
jgi:hypothetical protein